MATVNLFGDLALDSSVTALSSKVPAPITPPALQGQPSVPVTSAPPLWWRADFSKVIASPGVDTSYATLVKVGANQTVSQSAGNLVMTTGTTATAESIVRSAQSFIGAFTTRTHVQLSQRIANQQFYVEMVDVIGDGLAITIASATSATVTIPSNPFTSANVGQGMYLGAYTGTGVLVPGRYVIASVSGDNVTFTVAGATAGSGTVSAFGWNYHHVMYDATTATNTKYDTQRNGWNSGDTTVTISTAASPGHVGNMTSVGAVAHFSDHVGNSNIGLEITRRASRTRNTPAYTTPLYLQIRAVNLGTAPASTTTLTVGFASIDNYSPQSVVVDQIAPQSAHSGLPVEVLNTTTVAGTVTGNWGTPYSASAYSLVTAATTNAASVKASAGSLTEITVSNVTATAAYVKLYNKASAPTVGTDVPVLTLSAPANTTVTFQFGTHGKRFTTGIASAVTAGIAATDTAVTVVGIQVHATYF